MKLGKFEIIYIPPASQRKKKGLHNTRFFTTASFLLGTAVFNLSQLYATERPLGDDVEEVMSAFRKLEDIDDKLNKLDSVGNKLFAVACRIGYWAAIIMAVFEIIKCIKDGDTNAIWGIVAKYLLAFAALYMLPWLFDLISGVFA